MYLLFFAASERATLRARNDLLDLDSKVLEKASPENIRAMEALSVEPSHELQNLFKKFPEAALHCRLSLHPENLELKFIGEPNVDTNIVQFTVIKDPFWPLTACY